MILANIANGSRHMILYGDLVSTSQSCEMSVRSLLHLVATPLPRMQLTSGAARVPTGLLGLSRGSSAHPRAAFPAHL